MRAKESSLQQECVRLFRLFYPDFAPLFFAVPNGSRREAREAVRLKAEGVWPGVADMLLLVPRYGVPGVAIEFKTYDYKERKGRLERVPTNQSPAQREWQRAVEAQGYKYIIIRDAEEFIRCIHTYMNGQI